MINVIMHGCCGKMGHQVVNIVNEQPNMTMVGGVDIYNDGTYSFPVFASVKDINVEADVIIDFANSKAVDDLLDYCVEKNIPLVLCTTGLSPEQIAKVEESSKKVAILRSANMSMGVNLLMKVLADVSPILAEAGFDIEIVEKHHNLKLDAPSGTAIALADSINDACDKQFEYIYDRSQRRQKREKKELGISAVRGGTIVGDHDVIFAGLDEVITLSHRAYSKSVFAKGAVEAAAFLTGKEPGLYDMSDVINQ